SWRRVLAEPRVRVAASVRLSGLIGETQTVAAPLGWGFGLQLSASLLRLPGFRLGFVLDFAQDRFSREYMEAPGQPQLLVHNTFAARALRAVPTRWVRPFLPLGPGFSVSRHESPIPDPGADTVDGISTGIEPLLRLSAGVGISPVRWFEFGFGADLSL